MSPFKSAVAGSLIVLALATPTAIVVTRGIPELADQTEVQTAAETVEIPAGATEDSAPVIEAEVGELVRLSTVADHVNWKVLPPSPDQVSCGEQANQWYGSFRSPGKYHVLAGVVVEGKAEIREAVIQVGVSAPIPGPTPAPVGPWDGKVSGWLGNDPAKKPGAARLAQSFEEVANQISQRQAAGQLMTPDQIVALTAESNRTALVGAVGDWTVFRSQLAAELQAMAKAGSLSTMPQHIQTWREIASALRRFAS